MTKLISIIAFVICIAPAGMAQNRANIKGMVVDSASNFPIELATVAVVSVNDSSLVSYTAIFPAYLFLPLFLNHS